MKETIDRLIMEIQRSKFTEQRGEGRKPFVRPVRICEANNLPVTAFSKDISFNGIGLICAREFAIGKSAVLEIHSLSGQPACLRSEIRWSQPYGNGWYLSGWHFLAESALPASAYKRKKED